MELLFSILSVEIFETASLLLLEPWKEPALSKMTMYRTEICCNLDEAYGDFHINLCLYGVEDLSKFFLPFCLNEIHNQLTQVLCVASFPLFICLE